MLTYWTVHHHHEICKRFEDDCPFIRVGGSCTLPVLHLVRAIYWGDLVNLALGPTPLSSPLHPPGFWVPTESEFLQHKDPQRPTQLHGLILVISKDGPFLCVKVIRIKPSSLLTHN